MNREWSELNKSMQTQLRRESTFSEGIQTLLMLRRSLAETLQDMKTRAAARGFPCHAVSERRRISHSKTIAYSIWHIFRIEDIVAHDLICRDEEVISLFRDAIGAPIITTGNELSGPQITDFSKRLDLDALYKYAAAVKEGTDTLLGQLTYRDLRRTFDEADKERIRSLQVVSSDERSRWLIDYWCGKDVRGLIQMPFSRHWIMHVEACLRIKKEVGKIYKRRYGR